MNIEYIEIENIKIAKPLYDLVEQEIIPNTGINTNHFWTSFGSIINCASRCNAKFLQGT